MARNRRSGRPAHGPGRGPEGDDRGAAGAGRGRPGVGAGLGGGGPPAPPVLPSPADGQFGEIENEGERDVDWWISEGLGFVADHAVPRRRVREMKAKVRFQEFKTILREVKARKYQTAVVLHAPWWMTALLWLARVPTRVGPRSQWHSFLFLNKGVRQKRSLAEASEFEYNMRVMDTLADRPTI